MPFAEALSDDVVELSEARGENLKNLEGRKTLHQGNGTQSTFVPRLRTGDARRIPLQLTAKHQVFQLTMVNISLPSII